MAHPNGKGHMRKITFVSNIPATNAPATVTFAPVAGHRFRLIAVTFSYAGGTPVGSLSITGIHDDIDLGSGDFLVDIAGVQHGEINVGGMHSSPDLAMVVTLAAGGASVDGKLNVTAIREPENV